MGATIQSTEIPFAWQGIMTSDEYFTYNKTNQTLSVANIVTTWSSLGLLSSVVIGAADKLGQHTVKGRLKLDERPTGGTIEDYAFQIRSESAKTSGTHLGIDNETHLKATGTATVMSTRGVAVVDATYTATGSTLVGVYGQARVDGTFAGSGFVAGIYGLVEASTAITASHVCSAWLDSHQENAVTGSHELLYMSNNGAASLDQVIYASGQAEALLHLNTAGGAALNYVSATATTAGTSKKIKILIEGVTYYLNAYTG